MKILAYLHGTDVPLLGILLESRLNKSRKSGSGTIGIDGIEYPAMLVTQKIGKPDEESRWIVFQKNA